MKTQFELKGLEESRENDNYKIKYSVNKNGKCLIFFSSNGLYYPNEEIELQKIIRNDKYEWESLSPDGYEKIIYFRDTYKQWYTKGINKHINSVNKLVDFLKKETEGYNTRYIGSSAGGYAAVLFGSRCFANSIISISGQFDITNESKDKLKNKILNECCNDVALDISDIQSKIFYILPDKSPYDLKQYEKIHNNKNIHIIKIRHHIHGVPLYSFGIRKLITASDSILLKASEKTHNRLFISIRFITIRDFVFKISNKISKQLKR